MANNLIKLIIAGGRVVGQAFSKALKQEYQASQRAAQQAGGGSHGRKSAANDAFTGMSLQEAKEVLNISDTTNIESVQKSFDHLFATNDKAKGGSFYLQSKVFRAKERIDIEMKAQSVPNSPEQPSPPNT